MSKFTIVLAGLVVFLIAAQSSFGQYYFSGSGTIPLLTDSSKLVINFDEEFGTQQQEALLSSIGRIDSVLIDDHVIDGFVACALSTGQGYYDFIDSVEAIAGVYLVEPYYLYEQDSAFLVGLTFCVAFEESLTQLQIDSINSAFGVTIDHEIDGMPNVFILRNTDTSGFHLLDLTNTYYNLTETRYAHPEFGVWIQKHSYRLFDYYHNHQPHTKKVIGTFNSASVWDFAGLTNNVTVAVIDDGVDSHEDLPAGRVLPGVDYADIDNDPTPGTQQAHGMACAGIIGASHTTDSVAGLSSSTGVISLNPATLIKPVKIFHDDGSATGLTAGDLAQAITYAYASGAGVLSNSWGYGATCPITGGLFDVLNEAIENATILGRGGLGCPVIFAAGNSSPYISGVLYPACLPSVFAVGATQLNDVRWPYSSYGTALDIVAPSGDLCSQGDVWTLDQMNTLGFNPNQHPLCPPITWDCPSIAQNDADYNCNFGGTSAAAPVVSGVASLIISKDSNLTAQEIYSILESSAVTDVGPGPGPITPPDLQYGWGRVDAFRAILSISRGDLDNDGNIGTNNDLTFMVDYIFRGGPLPFPSPLMGDCNCDGDANNVVDMIFLVDYIYRGSGIPPVNPCYEF